MRRIITAIALGAAAIGGGLWGLNIALGGSFWGISGDEYVDIEASLPVLQQGDGGYPQQITYMMQLNTDPNVPATADETNLIGVTLHFRTEDLEVVEPAADSDTPHLHELTFHSDNWNTPQPITIKAIDDNIDNADDMRTAEITHRIPNYLPSDDSPVIRVTIHDDDQRDLSFDSDTVSIRRETTGTYTLRLATQPQDDPADDDDDITSVLINGNGNLEVAVGGSDDFGSQKTVQFTSATWNTPRIIKVKASSGATRAPGEHTFTVSHVASGESDYGDESVSGDITVMMRIPQVVARPRATATPRILPSSTPRATSTPTPEPAPGAVEETPTPTRTLVPTLTPTPSATLTPAPTPTFTATPPPTATPQADDSPPREDPPADKTATAEAAIEATATAEANEEATAVANATATAQAVGEITATAIAVRTATAESVLTATAIAAASATSVAHTATAVAGDATATAVAGRATATAEAAGTATAVAAADATATAVSIIQTAIAIETVIPSLNATATAEAGALATVIAALTATAEADGGAGDRSDVDEGEDRVDISALLATATAEAFNRDATMTAVARLRDFGDGTPVNDFGTPLSAADITATAMAEESAIAKRVAANIAATQTAVAAGGADSGSDGFGRELLDAADAVIEFLGPLAVPAGVVFVAVLIAAFMAIKKKLILAKVAKMVIRLLGR